MDEENAPELRKRVDGLYEPRMCSCSIEVLPEKALKELVCCSIKEGKSLETIDCDGVGARLRLSNQSLNSINDEVDPCSATLSIVGEGPATRTLEDSILD